jgi:hypothetical protein
VLGLNAFKTQTPAPANYGSIAIGVGSLGGLGSGLLAGMAAQNIAIGANALGFLQSSNGNIAIGFLALPNVVSNGENTCIGYGTCGSTGGDNTAVGLQALATAGTGGGNSAFGPRAGYYVTTGFSNSFFGQNAGQYTSTGGQNIIIGSGSTGGSSPTVTLTGNYNVIIGGNISNLTTQTGTIQIGDGNGNVRWDYGLTVAATTTINTPVHLPALATTGTAGTTVCFDTATNNIYRKAGAC